jgi:hypothetical protein
MRNHFKPRRHVQQCFEQYIKTTQRNEALDSATHALSSAVNNSSKGRKVSIALTNSISIISARLALRGEMEHWNGSGPMSIPWVGSSQMLAQGTNKGLTLGLGRKSTGMGSLVMGFCPCEKSKAQTKFIMFSIYG